MKRIIFALALLFTAFLVNFYRSETIEAKPALKAEASPNDLVVHEWGTFTSIAGKNGVAIDWRPLNGSSDLPKFVYKENEEKGFRGTYQSKTDGKGAILVKVRMETPVIYFYTKNEMDVSVNVTFPEGKITEWYPQAGIVNNYAGNNQHSKFLSNSINWGMMKLLPNEKPNYLREVSYSHYYPARETDSVPVQICNADKTKIETEKFLFYRGVGNFGLPLNVKLNAGKIALSNTGAAEIKNLIVFENRGGKIGFRFVEKLAKDALVERPETNKTLNAVLDELQKTLVAEGLYEKEAKAMIETWRDSWFEEGLRVFYILPRTATDKVLPLKIDPQPKETVRVLVGRTEVITPEMQRDVKTQVGLLNSSSPKARERARTALKKHGRFYEPILKNLLETETNAKVRAQLQKLIALS